MQGRFLITVLCGVLVATPAWAGRKGGKGGGHSSGKAASSSGHVAGGPSAGTVPETMSGYHSSAGYGSLYGAGYNDWTRNGWHDGQWHAIPYNDKASQPSQTSTKHGSSSASYASSDETQLIQQQIAARRAQQAQQNAQQAQPATPPPASSQKP